MKKYINDKGEFAPANIVVDGAVVMNPTEAMLTAAGYHEYVAAEKTLDDYKAEKIAEIEAYDSSSAVNSFTLGGVPMWLSYEERSRIRQSVDAYRNEAKTEMTKWFGGKAFTYTLDEWQAMLDKLSVYASEALNVTEQHKAEVEAMTDIEAVEGYDYKTGYPDKLAFSSTAGATTGAATGGASDASAMQKPTQPSTKEGTETATITNEQ